MTRPADLPDFADPPLNEVVVGVQFAPAQGYSQIRAGEVWSLFKSQFPFVEEHPPLPPQFETFGRPQAAQVNFNFVTGAAHDRFWFLSAGKEQLLQFQNDRMLHNWRKIGDGNNPYPRFEAMIDSFEAELRTLENYFTSLEPQTLQINQCEVSYINHLPNDAPGTPDKWLRYVRLQDFQIDDFALKFRRSLMKDGQPTGRLTCETTTAIANDQLILRVALTARGAPSSPDMQSALEFLRENREIVVRAFAELTTESAHQVWKRVQ